MVVTESWNAGVSCEEVCIFAHLQHGFDSGGGGVRRQYFIGTLRRVGWRGVGDYTSLNRPCLSPYYGY